MCKGDSSTSTIDGRVWDLMNQNIQGARAIAGTPFQPYTGQLTAPMNATQHQAGDLFNNFQNQGFPTMNWAANSALDATHYNAPSMSAQGAAPGLSTATPASFTNDMVSQSPATLFAHGATATPVYATQINRGDVQTVVPQTGLGNIGDYMNPYTQNVIDTTLSDMDRARQMTINGNAAAATQSGAFGGSRLGVADAETNRNFINQAGQMAAQLRNQGFDTASGLLQNDQNRVLQGALANQNADLSVAGQNAGFGQQAGLFNAQNQTQNSQFDATAANEADRLNAQNYLQNNQFNAGNVLQNAQFNAGLLNNAGQFNAGNQQAANLFSAGAANSASLANQQASLASIQAQLQGAGLLGNIGNEQFNNYMAGAGALNQFGTQQQQNQQAGLDAAYQQFLRQVQYPIDMQNVRNSALGLFNAGSGTASADAKSQQFNSTAGLLGDGLKIGSMFAFSDRALKTDIRTIRHDGKGRRWVAFRYLWDAPGTIREGVIAQEIERTDPQAVADTPFGKMVDYSKLENE